MKSTKRDTLSFQDWLKLTDKERARVQRSWNPYAGEGEPIVRAAHRQFKKKFGGSRDITNISYGVYHGGDWVISVTLKVGYRVAIPKMFLGIWVVKLYGGISSWLKRKLQRVYGGNVKQFVESEIEEFARCFNFTDAPRGREWLIKFVKEHVRG